MRPADGYNTSGKLKQDMQIKGRHQIFGNGQSAFDASTSDKNLITIDSIEYGFMGKICIVETF